MTGLPFFPPRQRYRQRAAERTKGRGAPVVEGGPEDQTTATPPAPHQATTTVTQQPTAQTEAGRLYFGLKITFPPRSPSEN